MSFKERLLGDLLTFQRGFDITKAEQSLGEVPIVSSSGISSFHNEAKVRGPGVVIGRKGTLGTVHYIDQDYWPHDTTLWVKDFKGSHPRFLSYFLTTLKLENFDTGASNPTLNRNHLHKIKVLAPDPMEQEKITAILATYDDLIFNNQRRIVLLESVSEEIFREWFVRMRFPGHLEASTVGGLPVGWTLKSLSEVAHINANSIRRGAEPEFIAYLDISAVGTNTIKEPVRMKFKEAPGRARRLARDGDMIWSSVRPGNKTYCLLLNPPDNLVVSTGFAVISPKPGTPFSYLSKAVTTQEFTDQMVTVAKGAAYPATSFDDFERAQLVWPADELLTEFHSRTAPLLRQVALLREQSLLLAKQRDALLPRLISGKLRVDQLDIQYPNSMTAELA
jgi:type I restriction enzyme S subunit